MANHSELCYGVAGLAKKVFTPAHMRDDPKMFIDRAMRGGGGGKGKATGKGTEVPPPEEEG